MPHFDSVVIGAGQAGPSLAVRLAGEGLKTAIVERGLVGGTCVNTGCTPTKALVASARVAHLARRAGEFGLSISGDVRADIGKVLARADAILRASRDGLDTWLTETENCTLVRGHARFRSSNEVEVNGDRLTADRFFIDVGGRAFVPPVPGLAEAGFLTNSSILRLNVLPDHLLVVGGSYVGLEFAQIFRRLGSRVTIVERSERLIAREDEDVSETVRTILEREGIAVHTGTEVTGVAKRDDKTVLTLNPTDEISGSHLLVAVGRRPNTDDLGLEAAGVATDPRGYITVDEQLRTSVDGIWALGECNGRGAFTHTSYNDYEIVAANLFDGGSRRVSDRITAYALYTDPPLGRAGKTESEARKTGKRYRVARRDMTRVARAAEKSETQGFMKILVEEGSDRILGAALLGIEGDEVIHTILDQMYAGAPYTVMQRAMHIHPTVSELLPTMLGSLASP